MSQAKHWCTICRVWTGGHKRQIEKHEGGRAHIENKERNIKDAADREKGRKCSEKEFQDELAEIERKALAAMAADARPPPQPGGHGKAAPPDRNAEKRHIEDVLAAAKKRKIDPIAAAWTRHVDPNSKVNYYYNTITKESSWEVPAGFVEPEAETSPAQSAPVDGPSANGSPWTATTDPNSGCQYFYNSVTQESTWEKPADYEHPVAGSNASEAAATICQPWPRGGGAASAGGTSAADSVAAASATPASGASAPAPNAPGAATSGGSPWVVVTDPDTGQVYYFNMQTKASQWDMPPDLGVDLSKPPPPPKKPPGPPAGRSGRETTSTDPGGWQEVTSENSMWNATTKNANEPDSDEDPAQDPVIALKYLTMQRGAWMDEDYERHEKEIIQKESSKVSNPKQMSFPLNRKKATGIRKRDDPEEDARCV